MIIKKYLGQTLADMGFITTQQLDEALQRQKQIMKEKASPERLQRDRLVTEARLAIETDTAPLLGHILNDMGFVTKGQLEQALQEQDKTFQAYMSLENEKFGIAVEIGALVNSTFSLAEVLHLIMMHANRVTNSVASTLMLVDETTGELVFSVPTGPKEDKLIDIRIPSGEGIAGWVVEHEKPALVPNVKEDARFYPKVDEISGFETKSMLCVPLKAKTKLIGVLEVINKVDGTFFTKEDELLLSMFGYQAAVAIENARLYGELMDQLKESKRAKDALRESEEKTRALLNAINDIALLLDTDGTVLDSNAIALQRLGKSADKLVGKCIYDFFPPPLAEPTKNAVSEVIRTGKPFCMEFEQESRIYDSQVYPICDAQGKAIQIGVISSDITERRSMEAQLRQTHKMEAIGTLAGGIAHDFNNILGIILGNTELAMDDVPEWNPACLNLEEIRIAGIRARDVVRQLLSFAHKTDQERKPVIINSIIIDVLKLLRFSIPANIEIRHNLPKGPEVILADPTQLNQIMINLFTNAAHAMEKDGGILEINMESVNLTASTAQFRDLSPGPYVKLSVSDTGAGIGPEIKNRIFDPYFTTKEVGKGSGMGLSVVHGIVMNHNGAISVDSELGKGATFTILLPTSKREPVPETTIDEELPTGKEMILFVDDEESIVKMGMQRLKRLGYKVESTTSPVEALDLFSSKSDQFDLVITDLTMPKMTGDKLVKAILDIRPDIPIILCTGFSEKINSEKIREIGAAAYLEKPHDKYALSKTVRRVLDKKILEQ
ncbi:MAG: response regulator [Desulfobacterales bacterium]|uniref:histidine kinase n=1 Tax=Candidatus Desulfatibia vada TaxID=2841696 RepID=A0A8J6TQ13_9BACT|nr:response regulator [Candidatus Desulfatibia vada]MBL6971214.1 response regulator [Desulfobacterales bacterium]